MKSRGTDRGQAAAGKKRTRRRTASAGHESLDDATLASHIAALRSLPATINTALEQNGTLRDTAHKLAAARDEYRLEWRSRSGETIRVATRPYEAHERTTAELDRLWAEEQAGD